MSDDRHDPDYMCQRCAAWWGAEALPEAVHTLAYCRSCGTHTQVAERIQYVITEAGRPQTYICFGCVKRHGGVKAQYGRYLKSCSNRCDICGGYKAVTMMCDWRFAQRPLPLLTTRPERHLNWPSLQPAAQQAGGEG
jgi:hypothetical protein